MDIKSYSCTRTLLSVGGIWSKGWQLIEFQLFPSKKTALNLQKIDTDLIDRKLLILDIGNQAVVGSMELSEFLEYLMKHPILD